MLVLDTNVLSALIKDVPDQLVASWLDRQADVSVWTTTITVFEIRYGLAIMPAGRRQSAMLAAFERALDDSLEQRILSLDRVAAEQAALLMARRRAAGRPIDLRDTMIAGIVVAQRATLVTRNVRDFSDLDLSIVDPWNP
jgi:hypothetical protein